MQVKKENVKLKLQLSNFWCSHLFGVCVMLADASAFGQIFSGNYFVQDSERAKYISGIDLDSVSTNIWKNEKSQQIDSLCFHAALDKNEFRLGEPIHLFVNIHNCSSEAHKMPRDSGMHVIKLSLYDTNHEIVQKNDLGLWHDEFQNPIAQTLLLTNRIKSFHIELSELYDRLLPGDYTAIPAVVLDYFAGRIELSPIEFRVTSGVFNIPSNAPSSILRDYYVQKRADVSGRNALLTPLEAELVARSEAGLKEAGAAVLSKPGADGKENVQVSMPTVQPGINNDINQETVLRPQRGWAKWILIASVAVAVLAATTLLRKHRRLP